MKIKHLSALLISCALAACGSSEEDASRITLGAADTLITLNALQYQQAFVVQVTDENMNPAPYTKVTITARTLQYYKGQYEPYDTDGDGSANRWEPNYSAACTAEDINNNGVLDVGEDINNNGTLEPTNPITISAHPSEIPTIIAGTGELVTDDSGFGYFVATYPKSEAFWSYVRLTATADVSGTENHETYSFILAVLVDDVSDLLTSPPGGIYSRYGSSTSCTDTL
ncbi:MAG TPA: hypothetical protein VIQ03_02455 [Gammaproteobacteria bacterium]